MDIKGLKKFILVFFVSIILLSFLVPQVSEKISYVVAATISGLEQKGAIKSKNAQVPTSGAVLPIINGTTAETTKKKPVGHAVEGAEFHEELWEKYSVIAAEDGGGNGKGGGANSKHSQVIGNKGEYDELGGVFGGSGGNYIGDAGFGSSGSATADELRRMKALIDESRAASISNEIANKLNQESLKESIEESERISASIQKKLRQEAIKAAISVQETYQVKETPHIQEAHNNFSSPTYNPDININRIVMPETYVAVPTAAPTTAPIETEKRRGAVINKDKLVKPDEVIAMLKGQTAEYVEEQINAPTAAETFASEIAPPEDAPVIPELPEQVFYDKPIVETAAVEPIIQSPEPADEIESSLRESDTVQDNEEKETQIEETEKEDGASGGEDAEKDADKEGDTDSEENQGDSKDKGLLHFEKKEDLKGKKVFEIETTGNIGLNPDFLSMLSTRTMMILSLSILFIIGAIIFFVRQRDKKSKKNYF